MRVAVLVAIVALAGCATPPSKTTPGPGATAGGWALDCGLGAFEAARNASWGQTCEARASHSPGPKEETWIAIDPTDVNNVVVGAKDLNPASSNGCVWNGVFVTHDGGKTWKDVTIGGKYADRKLGDPTYGYDCNTDPDFQFTKDGALHYGVEMYGLEGPAGAVTTGSPVGRFSQVGYKILLATSHDGGDTWPDIITFQPDFGFTTDYSRMTVSPTTQSIVEAIGSDGGEGCHVLASRDGGKSADPPVPVATPYGPACGSGADTAIAASPKGTIVLVGGIVGAARGQTTVVRSTDDGKTWVDSNQGFALGATALTGGDGSAYREPFTIELAYDLSSGERAGTLYAAYPSADRDAGDIYVRSSKDDGKTWTDAVRVNDDPTGALQWMSNVAVAGDGSVHVFFMDKRYDPAHKLIDITHAYSLDGGKTWTNERVSTLSFDGALGKHQDGFPFIGDYLGVACVANDCWAGFPDASNGATTVIAAAHAHRG